MRLGAGSLVLIVIAVTLSPPPATAQQIEDLSYKIEARIDFDRSEIRGQARLAIPFSLLWSPSEIRLDLLSAGEDSAGHRRLAVESVTADGDVELAEGPDGQLRVMLPAPAEPDDVIHLDVRFSSNSTTASSCSVTTASGHISRGPTGIQTS